MPQLEISSVNDHSCCSRCKIFEQWKSALCTLKLLGYKSFRRNSLCWCSSKLLQLTIQINCPVSLIHVIIWQMTITNCSKNGGWIWDMVTYSTGYTTTERPAQLSKARRLETAQALLPPVSPKEAKRELKQNTARRSSNGTAGSHWCGNRSQRPGPRTCSHGAKTRGSG